MNTLITWNQLREMKKRRKIASIRFLGGFPNRIGSGETHSLTVADGRQRLISARMIKKYLLKQTCLK